MTPSFIEADRLQLCYYEQNAGAPCSIFFFHGNSSSSNTWKKQFSSSLLADYRLIAIDLPAHGRSSASDDPSNDYSLPALGRLMDKAVRQLSHNKPYLLAGISLATNIVAEMLAYKPRSAGLVLAGPCITGPDHTLDVMAKRGADLSAVFIDDVKEDAVIKYALQTSASRDAADMGAFLNDYHTVRSPFRSSLFKTIETGTYSDQITLLQKAGLPMLGIFGKEEGSIDPDYLDNAPLNWWRNTIFKIEGASHLVNVDKPEEFNLLLNSFAADVFK